ncbi:MAG TPA: cytochrome c [Vicinamibacterales bacterium]
MRVSTSVIVAAVVLVGLPCVAAAQGAARGEQVYAAQRCQGCHMIGGKGNKNSPLDGVGARLSVADTKEWIVDPVSAAAKHQSTKKPLMPKTYAKLPAADVDALVAYMQSLK